MKKVLLIGVNAKYIHSNPAIYSIKAYCQRKYDVNALSLVEYTINQNKETIMADIYRRKPDIAAFSCYIWNWNLIQDIIAELPKILPGIQIWLGGPEVSYHGEDIFDKHPQITGIMVGEGEDTFSEMYGLWQSDALESEYSKVNGLCLKEGYTSPRMPIPMDELPFFYEDFGLEQFENHILYYESQRGCPFKCAYCLSGTADSEQTRVRLRSTDEVIRHMQFFLDNRVPQVKFVDRTFNCNAKNALDIWRYLKNHDNGVTNFHFEIAADLLTKAQLEVMKDMRPGLIQLEIGVQSTNEETLHAINRYMSQQHLGQVVDEIHSFNNIHQHLDLIAGLPYEDYDSFGRSFNDVYAMKPEQLQLGFLKVLKGSTIETRVGEYGIVYNDKPPYEVLYSKWLPYSDVLRLKRIEEMVEIYYNSNQFTRTLPVLVNKFGSAFAMFEALAEYYEENGYFINVPARVYRYQVLLEFAVKSVPKSRGLFSELLTFDLYLRENMKTRPCFASNWESDVKEKDKVRMYAREHELPLRMTHIERFEHIEIGENKPTYVLFDYTKRNPLTNDAFYEIITL